MSKTNGADHDRTDTDKILKEISILQGAVVAAGKDLDYLRHAIMHLYGAVIDLSDRQNKREWMEKLLTLVEKEHKKSWSKIVGPPRKKKK